MLNAASQIKMFIGYGFIQDKRDTIRDPFMFNSGFEVWIDSNYEVIKSHSWLELLLEEGLRHQKVGHINLFSLLHPDDLGVIEDCEHQMKEQGFFKISCRLYDGENYLWVTARGYPQKRGTPDRYAEVYVWPFAYEDFKTGDMYLVDVKKLWSKKQKRGKVFKAAREKYSLMNQSTEGPEHHCLDTSSSSDESSDMLRKRPRSDGESSESSESCDESPKRLAIDSGSSVSSPEPCEPFRPIPKRVSAFQARKGTFVPVAGSLPVLIPQHEHPVEKRIRVEPVVMHTTEYINFPASPEISSTGSRTPDSEPQELQSPVFPPFQDGDLEKSLPQFNISRLMQMNAVFKELKETNVGLFHRFADVLDPSGKPDAVGLLNFLPLILQLQERDLIEGV